MKHLTDLREILRYVPQFRDRVFVIAIDGAVVEDENFRNLLTDVALLRSLNIRVALVHGAGHQVRRLAEQNGQTPTNIDGTGVTDGPTLQLSLNAATRVTHEILEGLSATDLYGACSNAVVAHPAGILAGIDQQHTGRVERVESALLQSLLECAIIPVIPPIGCDGEGRSYRLNSDTVAVEIARALQAVKLIYLTTFEGIPRNVQSASADVRSAECEVRGEEQNVLASEPVESPIYKQLSVDEAEEILKREKAALRTPHSALRTSHDAREGVPELLLPKLEQAVRAARGGIERVHIIDGRVAEGLLAEVFSNEGIGTLIHANEYQSIHQAQRKDVRAILNLIQTSVESDELVRRTRADVERQLSDFFVFEVDRNPVACAALHVYPEQKRAELACVRVDARYENQGIGGKLMAYAEGRARQSGVEMLFCLSTQAFNYFQQKGGFILGTPDDLPPARRERYDRSGRRSMVLVKRLSP